MAATNTISRPARQAAEDLLARVSSGEAVSAAELSAVEVAERLEELQGVAHHRAEDDERRAQLDEDRAAAQAIIERFVRNSASARGV